MRNRLELSREWAWKAMCWPTGHKRLSKAIGLIDSNARSMPLSPESIEAFKALMALLFVFREECVESSHKLFWLLLGDKMARLWDDAAGDVFGDLGEAVERPASSSVFAP